MPGSPVSIVRAYEIRGTNRAEGGPSRVLVDRLWPRGVRKQELDLDDWPKDLTPSTELRRWYGHEPERWERFRRRYLTELAEPARAAGLDRLAELAGERGVELVTATRGVERSGAQVLAELLSSRSH